MKGKALLLMAIPAAIISVTLALIFAGGFLFMGTAKEETQDAPSMEVSAFGEGEIPPEFMPIYQAAAAEYKIPWNLLAAVHRVETVFSTSPSMESYAGAIGHMQFMPCTWTGWGHPSCGGLGRGQISESDRSDPVQIKRYGGFGVDANSDGRADPMNVEDAIYSAANYLSRNGAAEGDVRKAVFAYNHSEEYVSDVLGYMNKFAVQPPDPVMKVVQSSGGFARPSTAGVNSEFGQRFHPVLKYWRLHGGLDFDCATGDPITASRAGIVSYAGWMNANNPKEGYGLYVWVEHGGGFKTGYNHLSGINVRVGQKVSTGQVVGACGETGIVTGDHLHFEIFKNGVLVDPAPYLGIQ